eukprot:361462-Chlamydomonas_euryale.AAC.3
MACARPAFTCMAFVGIPCARLAGKRLACAHLVCALRTVLATCLHAPSSVCASGESAVLLRGKAADMHTDSAPAAVPATVDATVTLAFKHKTDT